MTETWFEIPGFDGYEVSDRARVRRSKRASNGAPIKVLKPWTGAGGVPYVSLRRDGHTHSCSVKFLMQCALPSTEAAR